MKTESRKATVYVSTFVVEGRGIFPFDMLRYDSCVPDRSEDAGALGDYPGERRRVRLRMYALADREPTSERWSSFGWIVLRSDYGTLVQDTFEG